MYDFNEEQKENILRVYESVDEYIKIDIKRRREHECFNIINRGQLWYELNVNTEKRKEEFENWYKEWLDATKTKVIPEKPNWLN